jgi:hypothetical protein
MSVSKAADSDRRSGVAAIKAEYVFMYLNCRNYSIVRELVTVDILRF